MLRRNLIYGISYGAVLGLLTVLMYWGKYRLVVIDHAFELYVLLVGFLFVLVGAWLGNKLTRPKTIIRKEIVIQEVPVLASVSSQLELTESLQRTGISQRELEVLQLLSKGLSNDEIASQLFVSQNTVKTHLSNLYFKLDVRRRTQAVDKARSLGLIA